MTIWIVTIEEMKGSRAVPKYSTILRNLEELSRVKGLLTSIAGRIEIHENRND